MQDKIDSYLREVTPINILDLLDRNALISLLNGYSFALGTGITVIYPKDIPVTVKTLERIDARDTDAIQTFNKICAVWRDLNTCGMEKYCQNADDKEAIDYFLRFNNNPRLYRCQPLGLFDMAYPLKIESKTVGVLFGGQIIIEDKNVSWRKVLKDYDEKGYVDWSTIPDIDTHIEQVELNINKSETLPEHKNQLLDILHSSAKKDQIVHKLDIIIKRFDDFLRFGEITNQLLKELYEARKTSAERQFIHELDEVISNIDLSEPTTWWFECEKLLNTLTQLHGIKSVRVYFRKKARYYCKVPELFDESNIQHITAGDVIQNCPLGNLVEIKENNFLKILNISEYGAWAYRAETGEGHEVCSTCIVFSGSISDDKLGFLSDLCSGISTDINLANLIFREREVDAHYRRDVALIGHSFRTPLQALQFNLEDLENVPEIRSSPNLVEIIESGKRRLNDAREDILSLFEPTSRRIETFNLVELVSYVITSMAPIAKKHPCSIVSLDRWPKNIYVKGIRYDIERAIFCLIDNAIKYSYHDSNEIYEVRIRIKQDLNYAKVDISNYGIGIPSEKINDIEEYGVRGEVNDERYNRLGIGLGLPYSIDVFEEYGGWINIESIPSKFATEDEKKMYHRYITIVEAVLPIAKGN